MDYNGFGEIARVAHESNAAYCRSLGDMSQPSWEEAPEWQRQSCISGVKFVLNNPDKPASASHENWLIEKIEAGWVHGPVKDPELKQHPCIAPFDCLPLSQQIKDIIFRSVVIGYSNSIT